MILSVIIINYFSETSLRACLSSLSGNLESELIEILVVDNGSAPGMLRYLMADFPAVHWIKPGSNLGFGKACNLAASKAQGNHLLFLNPDAILPDSSLLSLLHGLGHPPLDSGIAGLKIVNPDGSPQFSARSFPNWRTVFANRYSVLTRLIPDNPWSRSYLQSTIDRNRASTVDWASGAALVLPRAIFNELGGFDDRFFMYMEDVDLCLRANRHGVPVWYWPGAFVQHEIGASSSTCSFRALKYRHISIWRYYLKHLHVPMADPFVALFLLLRFTFIAAAGTFRRPPSSQIRVRRIEPSPKLD